MAFQPTILRPTFFCLFFVTSLAFSYSQSPSQYIDSLGISYQNLQDIDELMPPSNKDTSIQRIKIQMNLSLYIPLPELIKDIDVWVMKETKSEGKKELKRVKLNCVKDDQGVFCLTFKNKIYPIANKKVWIIQEINQHLLKRGCKLYVQAIPFKGETSDALSISLSL